MRSLQRASLMILLLISTTAAWSAPASQDPYLGYVYPAGGQAGTSFRVTIAGQRLRNAADVYVSGAGVHAAVIGYEPPQGILNKVQQEELRRQLQEIRTARTGKLPQGKRAQKLAQTADANTQPVALPDLPELRNLDQQTAEQLRHIADKYLSPQKRPKPPIGEEVTLQVTIDKDATLGDRQIRLQSPAGLSNPLVFQVGQIPELPVRDKWDRDSVLLPLAKPPVVLNGQIMPGGVDKYPLQLKAGQKLIFAVEAQHLIPYLADAVPGWFQAAIALYDPSGKQVAYGNECGYDPDPAFAYNPAVDGQYTLEVRDALYRGREDFIYRVDIADATSAESLFPMGCRGGVAIADAHPDAGMGPKMAQEHFGLADNPIPITKEAEPNDTGQTSMHIVLPKIISGTISKPGDKDVFNFTGHAGDTVVAEVYARRMGSALDSLVRLIDVNGKVVAWNDDYEDMESGLLTHQADSCLVAKLPASGKYFVQVIDAEGHGGPTYTYFLRVSAPRPDFALRIAPSCINVPAGRTVMATVYAMRKDGWDGDIDLALTDSSAGVSLGGGIIPKGRDHVCVTLTALPGRANPQPVALQLEGHAQVGGKTITRPVIAGEYMMQAFAYHHLVSEGQPMAVVGRGGFNQPKVSMALGERVKIPAGGSTKVSFAVRPVPRAQIHLELSDPPAGVTLESVTPTADGYTLTLKADNKHVGYADNLIVEAFSGAPPAAKPKNAAAGQRTSQGILPAIPFEIVKQ